MENRFETFTVLINRISRNIRKIKNQEMAEYGLRSAHVSCLYYLYTGNARKAALSGHVSLIPGPQLFATLQACGQRTGFFP